MPAGRPSEYPAAVRKAFLEAVEVAGIPYTRAAKMLRAGELPGCEAVPVSTSTCRGWKEKSERDRAASIEPDAAAYRTICNESLRTLSREAQKWARESRKPKTLDPKGFREHLATVKEARSLIPPSTAPETGSNDSTEDEPATLLERLAAQAQQPAPTEPVPSPDTPQPALQEAEPKFSNDGGEEAAIPVTTVAQPMVASAH